MRTIDALMIATFAFIFGVCFVSFGNPFFWVGKLYRRFNRLGRLAAKERALDEKLNRIAASKDRRATEAAIRRRIAQKEQALVTEAFRDPHAFLGTDKAPTEEDMYDDET